MSHYNLTPVGTISESRLFVVGVLSESQPPSEIGQKTENEITYHNSLRYGNIYASFNFSLLIGGI